MVGGGKAGNVMSPNPNAIAASDAFHVPLTSIMLAGVVPGIVGLIIAYLLAKRLNNKGAGVADHEVTHHDDSVAGPVFWWRLARRWSLFSCFLSVRLSAFPLTR